MRTPDYDQDPFTDEPDLYADDRAFDLSTASEEIANDPKRPGLETDLSLIVDELANHKIALEPVKQALKDADFYAYGTLDDENRWTIAADDEFGHVDVRVGKDGFAVDIWGTSPGLYAEEENEWRRKTLERLARMTVPNVARGHLAAHQTATWDENDRGVGIRLSYELPFNRGGDVGHFVRSRVQELEDVMSYVEREVSR